MHPCAEAVDLSHHLSELSRARKTSPIDGLARFAGRSNLISLAVGFPNEAYFPFASISSEVLTPDAFALTDTPPEFSFSRRLWKLLSGTRRKKTTSFTIPRYPVNKDDVSLASALQYGMDNGLPLLQKFIKEFVNNVYQPAFTEWTTLLHAGNTDGWSRIVTTLCNPGEAYITEEWTYPPTLVASAPHGIHSVGVLMDDRGMRSDELRKLLEGWDETTRGCKRPHVLYTIPVGQNPTGMTMTYERKKEIYDICVQYDIIIVEDDPYHFLQIGPYTSKPERVAHTTHADPEQWLSNLVPSFLKLDYQGRVIRLDTFSKIIAPGTRLGFFTCIPLFAERLERAGEISTEAPCGFSQSLVTQLLVTWKYEGYIRWLCGLAGQYKSRRNLLLDTLQEEFHMRLSVGTAGSWAGLTVYTAFAKPERRSGLTVPEKAELGSKPLFSLVPPTSGMFLWLKFHFNARQEASQDEAETLEMKLWAKLAEAGVLVVPGRHFAANVDDLSPAEGHFRLTYSYSSHEDFGKAVRIFGKVVRDFFSDQ